MAGSIVRGKKLLWLSLGLSLIGLTLTALIVSRPTPSPAFCQLLQSPYAKPLLFRDRLTSAQPLAKWIWPLRLADVVFGHRPPISIDAQLVSTGDSTAAERSLDWFLGRPSLEITSQVRVWLLTEDALRAMQKWLKDAPRFEILSHPRISTADGVEASLFSGQTISLRGSTNEVGVRFGCFPRVHPQFTELVTSVAFTEVRTNDTSGGRCICTNVDLAARLQVPKGCGVFLLQSAANASNGRSFGILVSAH